MCKAIRVKKQVIVQESRFESRKMSPPYTAHSHDIWKAISGQISSQLGQHFEVTNVREAFGGDINTSFVISNETHCFFVKMAKESFADMHRTESYSLQVLRRANALYVPRPIHACSIEGNSVLILEFLELKPDGREKALGESIARLHQNLNQASEKPYGFDTDNYIGLTPQLNKASENWPEFWLNNRLIPQIRLALKNGFDSKLERHAEKLANKINDYFELYQPAPSLLHGDLWGGNKGYYRGRPVIFDPATYYGDRETDIAMTELFGGFGKDFYTGYSSVWPLDKGYKQRKPLYNLYHLLNHLNLFGEGYLSRCLITFDLLLKH